MTIDQVCNYLNQKAIIIEALEQDLLLKSKNNSNMEEIVNNRSQMNNNNNSNNGNSGNNGNNSITMSENNGKVGSSNGVENFISSNIFFLFFKQNFFMKFSILF